MSLKEVLSLARIPVSTLLPCIVWNGECHFRHTYRRRPREAGHEKALAGRRSQASVSVATVEERESSDGCHADQRDEGSEQQPAAGLRPVAIPAPLLAHGVPTHGGVEVQR